MDHFMRAAIDQAQLGLTEGGIPIGSVLVHEGRIIGRGHNRRVQNGSPILHGEMDALQNAGRQVAKVYRESVLYTTLSPCAMCSGAILLYGIPRIVIGENQTFMGEEGWLRSRGVHLEVQHDSAPSGMRISARRNQRLEPDRNRFNACRTDDRRRRPARARCIRDRSVPGLWPRPRCEPPDDGRAGWRCPPELRAGRRSGSRWHRVP